VLHAVRNVTVSHWALVETLNQYDHFENDQIAGKCGEDDIQDLFMKFLYKDVQALCLFRHLKRESAMYTCRLTEALLVNVSSMYTSANSGTYICREFMLPVISALLPAMEI